MANRYYCAILKNFTFLYLKDENKAYNIKNIY